VECEERLGLTILGSMEPQLRKSCTAWDPTFATFTLGVQMTCRVVDRCDIL